MKRLILFSLISSLSLGGVGCLKAAKAPTVPGDNTEQFVRDQSERGNVTTSTVAIDLANQEHPIPREISEPRLIFPLLGLGVLILGYSLMKKNNPR